MGLGLFGGGVGLVKFLVKSGAKVTVTDLKEEAKLKDSLNQLEGLPIEYHLGGHREKDFKDTDIIFVNPAVPPSSPYLKVAQKYGVQIETEMNLFFKLCRAKIIGITGSNGKTTTTMLLYEILEPLLKNLWVGGNVGGSLLENIPKIKRNHTVILELSSFQLENLSQIKRSPHISLVLNITENHLDRHKTMKNYINAKMAIVKFQTPSDRKILNRDDKIVRTFSKKGNAKCFYFSTVDKLSNGVFLEDNFIIFRTRTKDYKIDISKRLLRGTFNIQNIAGAIATSTQVVDKPEPLITSCQKAVNSFSGVEHRLQFVSQKNGVKFYNDSIATNPASAIAALGCFVEPVILIAGGYDKKLSYIDFAKKVITKAKAIVLIGQTAKKIAYLISKLNNRFPVYFAPDLMQAVKIAYKKAVRGDVVLLSPACASYDMFSNFVERGNQFIYAVKQL
jgi:UDP-N-acetylmuramoylalanine--D-glutamate ligase